LDVIQVREGKLDIRDDFGVTRLMNVPFSPQKSGFSYKVKPQKKRKKNKKTPAFAFIINKSANADKSNMVKKTLPWEEIMF